MRKNDDRENAGQDFFKDVSEGCMNAMTWEDDATKTEKVIKYAISPVCAAGLLVSAVGYSIADLFNKKK